MVENALLAAIVRAMHDLAAALIKSDSSTNTEAGSHRGRVLVAP
ncbi:hypothetical protein [Amycolatopsis speibonae]